MSGLASSDTSKWHFRECRFKSFPGIPPRPPYKFPVPSELVPFSWGCPRRLSYLPAPLSTTPHFLLLGGKNPVKTCTRSQGPKVHFLQWVNLLWSGAAEISCTVLVVSWCLGSCSRYLHICQVDEVFFNNLIVTIYTTLSHAKLRSSNWTSSEQVYS